MIHVSFGTYTRQVDLGEAGTRLCPICRESTQYTYRLQYTQRFRKLE